MEQQNLNIAPTKQELINAGFKEDQYLWGCFLKPLTKNFKIDVHLESGKCRITGGEAVEVIQPLVFTKQKINDAFALFDQPLPQWGEARTESRGSAEDLRRVP